jgi:hypothetical protein
MKAKRFPYACPGDIMKKWKCVSNKIELRPGAFLMPAFLLLVLPWQWVGAAILAACVHEAGHVLVLLLTGGQIERIIIGGSGAVIETTPMDARRECVCAFAGPVGSALLLLFCHQLPRTAVCALVHCIYNLLPMFPLDGGRILRSILSAALPPVKAKTLEWWIGRCVLLVVSLGILFMTRSLGVAPLLLGICVLLRERRKNCLPFAPFGGTIEPVSKKEYTYDPIATADSPYRAKACTVHRRRV